MRTRLLSVAAAVLIVNVVGPADAQPATALDRPTVLRLVKQVWNAGTWDEQRAAFDRLPERERVAVWNALLDVRPGKVIVEPADSLLGPCQDQSVEECDYAPAPQPSPTANPETEPSRPPVVTPPTTTCTSRRAYISYYVFGEPQFPAFTYAAQLDYCFLSPSASGPLTNYSSYSYAAACCKLPWRTDPAKYIDRLTAQPPSNTTTILDHHTGWFQADATIGPVAGSAANTPNIDSGVVGDGSYWSTG